MSTRKHTIAANANANAIVEAKFNGLNCKAK